MKRITALLLSAIMIFTAFVFPTAAAEKPTVSASSYVVFNADSGQSLTGKNIGREMDPSGLTALAVAYLYVTQNTDLEKEITVSFNATDADVPGSVSSMLGLKKGDKITASDLLSAVFAAAYPDAVRALAEDMSENYKTEIPEKLNAIFAEEGLTTANFSNIYGEYDYEHYISVDDYCRFIAKALKNETFASYFTETKTSVTVNGRTKTLKNSYMQLDGQQFKYEGAIGGLDVKYLSSSARSLVSVAEKDGVRLICVIVNASSEEELYDGAESLFEYGFNEFSYVALSPSEIPVKQVETEEGKEFAKIFCNQTLDLYLNNNVGTDSLLYHVELSDNFGKEDPTAILEITQSSSYQYSVVATIPLTVEFETYNTIGTTDAVAEKKGISTIDVILIVTIVVLAAAAGVIAWFMFRKKKRERRKARFRKMEKLQDRSLNPSDVKAREEKENLKKGLSSVASEVEYFGINEDYVEPPKVVKTERRGTNERIEAAKREAEIKREETVTAEREERRQMKRTVVTDESGNEISSDALRAELLKRAEESRKVKGTFAPTITKENGEVIDRNEALKMNVHSVKEEVKPRTGTRSSITEAKKRSEEDRISDGNSKKASARTVIKTADGKIIDKNAAADLGAKDRQTKESLERTSVRTAEKRKARPGELVIKEIKNPDGSITKVLAPDGEEV